MAQNLTQPSPYEDEIDLREIFKILIDSKKLIIVTILIFTIASIIYSLSVKPKFKSSTILEIGYTIMPDGTQKSIEEPSDLISNLNLYQFLNDLNKDKNTLVKAIENKLILIETTSKSGEKNENLLLEIIRDIDERHSNLTFLSKNQKNDEISLQIEMIESEISFIRALELSKIEDRLAILSNELPIIEKELIQLETILIQLETIFLDDTNNLSLLKENENLLKDFFNYKTQINALNRKKSTYILQIKSLNNQLKTLENDKLQSEKIFSLEQEKVALENELQMLMNQTHVNTRLIGNIETKTLKSKTLLIISFGIIIGFITSIFLVFINNFIKSYRESEA